MDEIWERLLGKHYVDNTWEYNYKIFAIKICQNDLQYVKDNYQQIIISSFCSKCIIIATFSSDVNIILFLIDKFKTDMSYKNEYGNNCLTLACSNNTKFEIIKYFIEDCMIDVEQKNNEGMNCLMNACEYNNNNNIGIIKYLIENTKIDIRQKNINGDNCLMFACRNKSYIEIIKYLIEKCKMNVNDTNNDGNNCLMFACNFNSNMEIIKYLIEDCKLDVNLTNNLGNNCLIFVSTNCSNIKILKYLIEVLNMKVEHKNKIGDNCLLLASRFNENIEIIKYLVEVCQINENETNLNGDNCLMYACLNNSNIEIIKYFINVVKINIEYKNKQGNNCLMLACTSNLNLEIIKYLIEECKINLNCCNVLNSNCLTLACMLNTNLNIIKYLLEECKMDSTHKNKNNDSCLLVACWKNTNLLVIKYLIEIIGMNVNEFDINFHNCITVASNENKNFVEIISYLINHTNITLTLYKITFENFLKFVPFVSENYYKFNHLLELGIEKYSFESMLVILNNTNPLLLNHFIKNQCKIDNPFNGNFKIFCNLVNELKSYVPLNFNVLNKNIQIKKQKIPYNNYNKCTDILFEHNNICYYGNRNIVFNEIHFLKEIEEIADISQHIILSNSNVPKYIINKYLQSCYDYNFDIEYIKPCDIIHFLKFIDQYPTNLLSIDQLEFEIIDYFEKNNIIFDDFINTICIRYQLKNMYLNIHNIILKKS